LRPALEFYIIEPQLEASSGREEELESHELVRHQHVLVRSTEVAERQAVPGPTFGERQVSFVVDTGIPQEVNFHRAAAASLVSGSKQSRS
jgi:hypothetical protein